MLVLDDEAGAGALMADDLHERLERLGVYRREGRGWLPHITVVRHRRPGGLRPANTNICTIVPSDAAAYLSRLSPGGAQYEILESVALGG
jgi:2'-5' RNA ligase